MAISKVMLVAMVAAFGLVAAPAPSAAKPAKCVFQKSCSKRVFRCFRAAGSCRQDAQPTVTSACWDGGAKVTQDFGAGTITVLGKKGRPCVVGTVGRNSSGEFQVTWTRKKNTVVFTQHPDGTRSFTCPNGKVETYTTADFRAGQTCGHIPSTSGGAADACTAGSCQ